MTYEILGAGPAASRAEVVAAIRTASRETGSDFDYLLATARRESNLDNSAKSRSSSASGLFQFIDQTWLSLVKRYGGRHGLGRFAEAIDQKQSGRYAVASSETKSAILALRSNPEISALMAGEAAAATRRSLECALGRRVCSGELYAAHFFGEGGARRLIGLARQDPGTRADIAFPEAAKANRNVFYRADGSAKSIGEVYAWAVGQPAPSEATPSPTVVAASAEAVPPAFPHGLSASASDGAWSDNTSHAQRFSNVAIRTSAYSAAKHAPVAEAALPRSPLALSAGVLEILAALTPPSPARRQA